MHRRTRPATAADPVRSCCFHFNLIALVVLAASRLAIAGLSDIAPLSPFPQPNVSPGIDGIAFDGTSPDPLVIDRWAFTLARINHLTGATLNSQVSNPVNGPTRSLAYDRTSGYLYTARPETTLTRIDKAAGTHVDVGHLAGGFNFLSLSTDPLGNLWLATDNNGGELWSVDKITGAGTLYHAVNFGDPNRQLTSFAIDSAGNFFVSARIPFVGQFENIYRLNPATGATTFVTSTGQNPFRFLVAMAQDPISGDFYGISNHLDSGAPYYFAKISGIPEPATIASGMLLFAGLVGRRRRLSR